jgi:hypothetical protein
MNCPICEKHCCDSKNYCSTYRCRYHKCIKNPITKNGYALEGACKYCEQKIINGYKENEIPYYALKNW